jgi:hypothetical protein
MQKTNSHRHTSTVGVECSSSGLADAELRGSKWDGRCSSEAEHEGRLLATTGRVLVKKGKGKDCPGQFLDRSLIDL